MTFCVSNSGLIHNLFFMFHPIRTLCLCLPLAGVQAFNSKKDGQGKLIIFHSIDANYPRFRSPLLISVQQEHLTAEQTGVAASGAKFFATVATYPTQVVRTRLQLQQV
jgi:hypothetical protein